VLICAKSTRDAEGNAAKMPKVADFQRKGAKAQRRRKGSVAAYYRCFWLQATD
jgi:hypothetical protein